MAAQQPKLQAVNQKWLKNNEAHPVHVDGHKCPLLLQCSKRVQRTPLYFSKPKMARHMWAYRSSWRLRTASIGGC
eukprot:1597822-Amphidinium_carterae.1